MIASRLVFLFPGFEPMSAGEHADRFCRGARTASKTWNVAIETPEESGDAPGPDGLPALPIAMSGEGWRTDTELVVCDWGDLIGLYSDHSPGRRLAAGIAALCDFVATGTFLRYCRVSWRYALFFLYPIVILLVALAAGLAVALAPALFGWSAWNAVWSVALGCLVAAAIGIVANRRLHLLTAMDDWAFARDLCRGRNPAITARMAAHGEALAARMAETSADEIVVAAHSLGASLAVVTLADALKRTKPSGPVHLLTVGSSLMKTALHPAAGRQRDAVRALVAEHRLAWVDVQAVSDPINFYRSNPARSLGITEGRVPVVRRISLRDIVSAETYRRIRRNFFRLHRQFVFGVERRHTYSFHMILLGPVAFERYAEARDIGLPPLCPAVRAAVERRDARTPAR